MSWTSPAPASADGPLTGDDRPMLESYLRWQRATLLNICAGLTGEQMAQQSVPPSNLSLLGLVRHMAKVERVWFSQRALGKPIEPMYDPALGKDADFEDLDAAYAPEAVQRLQDEWAASDRAVAGLDFETPVSARADVLSLRFVYVHMIGEYARHNGHADLLRQSIDGTTGR
ncbi:DinB family protein [Aeromicrobium sp.]